MGRRFLAALGAAVLALMAGGCATMTTGTSQSIAVNSQPDDADCTLTRDGATLATIKTPTAVTVKRDAKSIHVRCRKNGYEDGMVVLTPGFESASAANFVLGGLVGAIVDAQSGASNRYQDKVMVALAPAVGGSSAAAAAAAAAAQAPVPAQAPPPFQTGAWSARSPLIADRSAGGCVRDGGAYTLDLTGDTLTVDNVNGRMLTMMVPADGRIEQAFRSPSGAQLTIVGNARARDLEIVNAASACRWKLTPAT